MTDLVPNEILVRYDENGRFQGAHVAYLKLIRDASGAVVHREAQTLVPISRKDDPAFMDVLSKVLTDALTENNELKAQIAAHENDEPAAPAPTAPIPLAPSWPLWVLGAIDVVLGTYLALHLCGVV